jgi:signal transduction histidine kinase/CheY-like chemotaxis protein
MTDTPPTVDFQSYFADLQEGMVILIVPVAIVISYLWLFATLWSTYMAAQAFNPGPPLVSYLGSGLLIFGSTASLVLRRSHVRLATNLFAWSVLAAVTCAIPGLALPPTSLMYLFILPVLIAGALLGQVAFLGMAATADALAVAFGLTRADTALTSPGMVASIVLLLLVTLVTWLSTRRLYVALEWVWTGYQRANHNEQVARDRQGELHRTLKALDEATYRLERANYMLALARDQAEEARRLKQQFAQSISHELRTPLNMIIGFVELMIQSPDYYGGQLPRAYSHDMRIVYRNALHLQTLVNDVLELARLDAAQTALVPEETDPGELVRDAVGTARSLLESQRLALHTEVEPGLPHLWIDPTRIRQVLFNLLNNASRFTESGGVTVSVCRQGAEVVFAVTDTGVGIPPEHIGRIFEEFQQVDGSTRRRHGGMGLGLAISKRFVTLHGGRIWVESAVGKGSSFYFALPIVRLDVAPAPGTQLSPNFSGVPDTEGEKPVLLAVTPSLTAATLLTRHVRGCETVAVADLEQARSAATALMPQAVVIDCAPRDLDAAQLADMAQQWGLPRVPFMTCPISGEESRQRRLAADAYLVKPVTRQGLWDTLRRFGDRVDRVLVIDGDRDFVKLLERMLDSPVRRYGVLSAHSAQEGLAMMQRRPDLVLLDLGLPDRSGDDVAREIRAHPEWQGIPLILLSGQDELDTQQTRAGAVTTVKAAGLTTAEALRWVQDMVDAAVTAGSGR